MTLVRAKHSLSPAKRSVTAEIGSSRAGRWDWPQLRLAQASPSLTDSKQGVEKHRTPNTEHRTLKRRAFNDVTSHHSLITLHYFREVLRSGPDWQYPALGMAINPQRARVCSRCSKSRHADRAGEFFGHQRLRSLARVLYLPERRTLQGCA